MTRRRDRYTSQLEETQQQGPHVALWDVSAALWLLQKYLRDHDLLTERVVIRDATPRRAEESITLGELFPIANEAIQQSVYPAICVYRRLQQNAEAALVMADAAEITDIPADTSAWREASGALISTLNDQAIAMRGTVSLARRIIARREKEVTP